MRRASTTTERLAELQLDADLKNADAGNAVPGSELPRRRVEINLIGEPCAICSSAYGYLATAGLS